MITAIHPQIDGLIESVNESMQQYALLHLDKLFEWVSHLPMIVFYYDFLTNETSTHFLFEVSYQHQRATLVDQLLRVIRAPVLVADDRLSTLINV